MKKISEEQCNQIVNIFFDLNAPVKIYGAIKELFEKLPTIEEKK